MVDPFEVVMAGEAGRTLNGSPGQIRKEAALRIALRCRGFFVSSPMPAWPASARPGPL